MTWWKDTRWKLWLILKQKKVSQNVAIKLRCMLINDMNEKEEMPNRQIEPKEILSQSIDKFKVLIEWQIIYSTLYAIILRMFWMKQ